MKHLIGKNVEITYHGMICTTYTDMAKKLKLARFVNGWGEKKEDILGKMGKIISIGNNSNRNVYFGISLGTHDIIMACRNTGNLPFRIVETDLFSDDDFLI